MDPGISGSVQRLCIGTAWTLAFSGKLVRDGSPKRATRASKRLVVIRYRSSEMRIDGILMKAECSWQIFEAFDPHDENKDGSKIRQTG